MLVTKQIEWDMGHRVPSHKGKCKNLHGHRYKIEVGVDDKVVTTQGESNEGMVIDFSDLKEIMVNEVDTHLDHGFMMYTKDSFAQDFSKFWANGQKIIFVTFIPTAENIAKYLFDIIKQKLYERNIRIKYVKIWETPTSTATYTEENTLHMG